MKTNNFNSRNSISNKKNEIINDEIINDEIIKGLVDNLLPKIDENHISNCNCQNKIINKFALQEINRLRMDEGKQILKEDNLPAFRALLNSYKGIATSKALNYINNNNIKCPYQRQEMLKLLSRFNKKYDLNDPRVYEIVKQIMMQEASLLKALDYSMNNSIAYNSLDKFDNIHTEVNKIEYLKGKLSDSIIHAIKILDEITEGNKNITLNLNNSNIKSISEIFGSIKSDDNFIEINESDIDESDIDESDIDESDTDESDTDESDIDGDDKG